ncbi:DJ-1/PfpI family protein [Duganella vulcania]|uniref:DJ-1/PfpI family protein n=1 Tax=Duganella vulcania TaxID=2692166 RepID=A0A845GS77_9BURK|nr:DJ-1/PfpI family protein [Duganella vulcania]MYM96086.1 DJ-1/PfpI family protein [Duganella vulcania]
MSAIPETVHLKVGALIFPQMGQADFTGPFEALSRIPNSTFYTIWKDKQPVVDMRNMRIVPDTTITEAPQLDLLLVPGGYGQEKLMEDKEVLAFIRSQAKSARYVFSVCTGALLCGAAGLLHGKRATTHWTALSILPFFGGIACDDRVVVDGKMISAGGVTAGIDGSLVVVALLRDENVAQELQLYMAYDPAPPFNAGHPKKAPVNVLKAVTELASAITEQRTKTARAYRARWDNSGAL